MNVEAYLKRINYHGSREPNTETLRALQVAHLLTVPFENLSIHAGEPIVLDEEALYAKIVARRRGGFCYEVNGLFAALLSALGFEVARLGAGVARSAGGFGPNFDHMTLMVTLADRWLVDVGFGDSFLEPLLLDARTAQTQGTRDFRIDDDGGHLILLRRDPGAGWEPQYRFTLEPYTLTDYDEMCRFHQTSPESHFTRGRMCSLATPDGRVTLSGVRLITSTNSKQLREERTLSDKQEYERVLHDLFGIVMNKS